MRKLIMQVNLFNLGELLFSFNTTLIPEVGEIIYYSYPSLGESATLKIVRVQRFLNLYSGGITQEYLNIDVDIINSKEITHG